MKLYSNNIFNDILVCHVNIDIRYNIKCLGVQVIPYLKWNNQRKKLLNEASRKIGLLWLNCSFNKK